MTHDASATICELAPMYVLGTLDEQDAWLFQEHLLDGCRACRIELDEAQAVVDLLAVEPEPHEPSPILRDRLMDAIRGESSAPPNVPLWFEERGPWQPHDVPGIDVRPLHVDRATREVVMLVRARAGAKYPMHRHAAPEDLFMLRGELAIDGAVYKPGDFVRSDGGTCHGIGETSTGCMFLMRASLDDERLGF